MIVKADAQKKYPPRISYSGNGYDPEFCCDEMADAWKARAIGFGEAESAFGELCRVCLYKTDAWPEGASTNSFPIAFCPFCAEPIKIEVTEREYKPVEWKRVATPDEMSALAKKILRNS